MHSLDSSRTFRPTQRVLNAVMKKVMGMNRGTEQTTSRSTGPVVLLIRDGWGIGKDEPGNAVLAANTPIADQLLATAPHATLEAAGEAVGLRAGVMGSSEVGHLNMGAGRIVTQEMARVDSALKDGSLFQKARFRALVDHCLETGAAFHLMGLVQDQGVHAEQAHLHAILRHLASKGLKRLFIHFFSDGRDTPPRSARTFLERLEALLAELGVGAVASVMGRYYGMDRATNWDRTELAFRALVLGEGRHAHAAREAIDAAYARADAGEKPGEHPLESDEFIGPTLIVDEQGQPLGLVQEGDAVLHFNYRQDRTIQLTRAFVEPGFDAFDVSARPAVVYAGLTKYYDEFEFNVLDPLSMEGLLGEVLSELGISQLRISEFQKFRHVTSFFNGKRIEPYPLEDRVMVPSITIPEDQKPEMSAYETTTLAEAAILGGRTALKKAAAEMEELTCSFCEDDSQGEGSYPFIAINLANCDMVGHTGVFDAAVRAVESVDECTGRILAAVERANGSILITADHGNAEEMLDASGNVQTAHSLNDVDAFLLRFDGQPVKLRSHGILSDVAPTMLELLGIKIPEQMTAQSLLEPSA